MLERYLNSGPDSEFQKAKADIQTNTSDFRPRRPEIRSRGFPFQDDEGSEIVNVLHLRLGILDDGCGIEDVHT